MCVSANRVCVMSVFVCRPMGRFVRDVHGGITAFTVTVFLLMVLAVGMATDFMRQETMRAELQNAVDRGVLAAAALTQTVDDEVTVRSYIRSTNFVPADYTLAVVPSVTAEGFTQLTATASYSMPTSFLKLAGITSLPVTAKGAAIEGISSLEISLVLDVSTSMSYETTGGTADSRLSVMKGAAKGFVNQVLGSSAQGSTTISLVPFAGQVNPGPVALAKYGTNVVHSYSNCIDFQSGDFSTTAAPSSNSRNQSQYFQFSIPWNQKNGVTYPEIGWGWCPGGVEEEIIYHSDNATTLNTAIDALNSHEATGTQIGAKWGVTLLDPTSNGLTTSLVTAGDVSSAHSQLPAAYSDQTTRKFLVVMSDGNTTQQIKVKSHRYDTASERTFFANNLSNSQSNDFQFNSVTTSTARQQFLSVCQAARDAGIVVFTIGFDIEVGSDAHTDMSSCASSPSHFFDVDGLDLTNAFSAIAQTIQKLKLVG